MASADDRYLPDLSKVFAGETTVFSWYRAFQSLKAGNNQTELRTLRTSERVKDVLRNSAPTLPEPSQQSKSSFETKTSAIHVTPSAQSSYDIVQIKDDTAWLSKQFKLAEDEALRITILEWEFQPNSKLQAGFSDAERASIRDVFGKQTDSQDNGLELFYPLRSEDLFESQSERRRRLVHILCREEAGLIAVSRYLSSIASSQAGISHENQELHPLAKEIQHQAIVGEQVKALLGNVELRLQTIAAASSQEVDDDDLQIGGLLIVAECQNIRLLLDVLLLKIRTSAQLPNHKDIVLQWFHIARESSFFSTLNSINSDMVRSLQATAAILSIAMLDSAAAVAAISGPAAEIDTAAFYLDSDTVEQITQILLAAVEMSIVQAGPAALVWSLLLDNIRRAASSAKDSREGHHVQKAIDQGSQSSSPISRRTSFGSLQQSIFEDIMDHVVSHSPVTDLIGYLLRCSTEVSHAFETLAELAGFCNQEGDLVAKISLQVLQETVSVAITGLGYTPDVLGTQFAILRNEDSSRQESGSLDIRESFIENDFLMGNLFAVAAGRFPYESLPFLRLCRLLVPTKIFDEHGVHYITYRLRTLESFTQMAVGNFALYNTVREDENLNLVSLEAAASMLGSSERKLLTYGADVSSVAIIPASTIGEVISETAPPVIRWQHSFSGLSLIGSWLELHYLGQLQFVLSQQELSQDVATEIVLILSSLVLGTFENLNSGGDYAERQVLIDELFAEASSNLQNDFDIIACVFEIMEQELQAFRRRPSNTFNTSLLVACTKFMTALVQVKPDQFWTTIGNSSLLQLYGSSDFLYSIVTAVEVSNQDFPFLKSCATLFNKMIDAALLTSRSRSLSSKIMTHRGIAPQTQKLQASILLGMTQSILIAFENLSDWSFHSISQMTFIVDTMSMAFSNLLFYAYGIGEISSKQHVPFRAAGEHVHSQLRPAAQDGFGVTAVVKLLMKSAQLTSTQENLDIMPSKLPTLSLVSLAHMLTRLGRLSNVESSLLEIQLFDAVPILFRLMSADEVGLLQVSQLATDLLPAVERSRMISLLGHLGSTSSLCVLDILKAQQQFSSDTKVQAACWKLMAHLVGQKQQWLALVILSGSPPEKNGTDTNCANAKPALRRGTPIMDLAVKSLAKISSLSSQVAVAMLEFIIQAQQNWSWTATALTKEKDFLPALINYIRDTFIDASSPLKVSYRNRIAALVTDLSIAHLHYARATQQKDIIKIIMSLIFFFAENEHMIKIDSYNSSLHANLKRNFADKFPGLDVADFKRTQLLEEDYGDNYYYDLSPARLILQYDPHWNAANHKRDQSFASEFQRANLNLSVTESEIALFRSAKHFCIEHCGYMIQDGSQKELIKPKDLYPHKTILEAVASITRNCLRANSDTQPVQKLFDNVFQSRADLAVALLQKLVDVGAKGFEIKGLLKQAWICARTRNASYDQALANGDLIYWRSTLKILLLTLQFHSGGTWSPPAFNHEAADMLRQELTNVTPVILEVMTVVVGDGFRTIVAAIQEQRQASQQLTEESSVSLDDLSLVLSLLNTMLRITRAPEYVSEGSGRLISSGIIPTCCLLYSWSHTLIEPQHDNNPVYADLALQYLSALSTLPPVAEEMGVEGVLSRLLSGRTTQKLQNLPEGAGHLDPRPHCRFLYSLWASGMLPICLNLLHSMGAPIAAEISVFLNQFPLQLSRASSAFVPAAQSKTGGSNSITFEVARESSTLALISFILESYRRAGASAAVDPTMIMPLKGYDEHKKALSDDISDVLSTGLSGRVTAVTEEDTEWARKTAGTTTLLEKRVLNELKDALTCLRGQEADEEEK